jgi:hypothetical protein
MMNLRSVCGFVLAGLLSIAPAQAAETSAVRAMMEQSGMVAEAANLGEAVRLAIGQVAQEEPILSPDATEAFMEIAAKAFDGERLLKELETVLADTLSAAEIKAVTDFYTTPLGTRIKAAEVPASSGETMARIEARESELRAELERNPERLAIARTIDELLYLSEVGASIILVALQAMDLGTAEELDGSLALDVPAGPESEPPPEYAAVLQSLREWMLADFAETYRNIPLDDLRRYVEFLKTDAARATHAAILVATTNFLEAGAREVGRGIANYMKQKET